METVLKVIRMIDFNEYKRYQAPPVIKISSKAFELEEDASRCKVLIKHITKNVNVLLKLSVLNMLKNVI